MILGCRPREGKEAKRRRWRKKRAAFEEAPRLADAKRLGIGRCDGACGLHPGRLVVLPCKVGLPSPRGVRIASVIAAWLVEFSWNVAVPARGADCIMKLAVPVERTIELPSPRGVRIASKMM